MEGYSSRQLDKDPFCNSENQLSNKYMYFFSFSPKLMYNKGDIKILINNVFLDNENSGLYFNKSYNQLL